MDAGEAKKLTLKNLGVLANKEMDSIMEGIREEINNGNYYYEHKINFRLYHIVPLLVLRLKELDYEVLIPLDIGNKTKHTLIPISWHPFK